MPDKVIPDFKAIEKDKDAAVKEWKNEFKKEDHDKKV